MALSLSFCTLSTVCGFANTVEKLEQGFQNPPENARPWIYWLWINGNITKEGITADLESFKRIGIGGVLWMEVSGPWWAPDGEVEPRSPKWHDAFQWAISECERLGLTFDVTLDFGYGSGGPHITPERSMQKLVWSEQEVEGGQTVELMLKKPHVERKISAWLRPGVKMNPKVVETIEQTDSYRDVTVLAIPLPASQTARDYRIPAMPFRSGLSNRDERKEIVTPPGAVTPKNQVLDLTTLMGSEGRLQWKVPPGKWLIMRYGHASNYKMTRPCPAMGVGLECDRLSQSGIEAHFDGFLKKIIEDAGSAKGGTLAYAHIDSWEAGAQNWTASFPEEFQKRRGYDLRPWLPILTGLVVGSADLSERFLWDVRLTASEMIQENYVLRFRELLSRHSMKLSIEAYGDLSIDNLSYAGISDMPISEFWACGEGQFPISAGRTQVLLELSSKAMASAAHTYGKSVIGAEAFTSDRGWRDHPFLLKSMGDKMFCYGVNRMVFHLAAHQPYDAMIPGMTHRRWGQHIQRHNTWFEYSEPWMDYLSRCQYLLQEGTFVADVCYWFGEGAPLKVTDMSLNIPEGYDYDLCSSELVLQMKVHKGRIILPSGMSYRYLLLPDTNRMTLPLARKIKELVDAGGRVIAQKRLIDSPSLTDYQKHDSEIKKITAELWDSKRLIFGKKLEEVFVQDKFNADFEGEGLRYIHRRFRDADIYFVSNPENRQREIACTFRVSKKLPELWNPETGTIRKLPEFTEQEGGIMVPLHFDPMQSWFVVFRKSRDAIDSHNGKKNFVSPRPLREIAGGWQVAFDTKWGGPERPVKFEKLIDWSTHTDPKIHYYSGTATYQKTFELSDAEASGRKGQLMLDLGLVDVMARVRLNGKICGIVWKPPYRVDITPAARSGANKLEIDAVNLWINRMIGDEQLPEDSNWKDFETLLEWPEWFKEGKPRPSGRFTFTSCKHYKKDTPLVPSGLLGPVTIQVQSE